MKNPMPAASACAFLLCASSACPVAAQAPSPVSILFARTFTGARGVQAMALYRVKPAGTDTAQLAPRNYGFQIRGASWSPSGAAVVYESAEQLSNDSPSSSHLYVVDRQGGSLRRITTGPALHGTPSWGPNGLIAFITNESGPYVRRLATVRADGTDQHIVFCPPREAGKEFSGGSDVCDRLLDQYPQGALDLWL